MTSLLLAAALASPPPCADVPAFPPELGLPPNGWPSYPGRCLDAGSAAEALVDRVRRCVLLEPEDEAHVRLLGLLGDIRDLPVLEAMALRGTHGDRAVDAMQRIDPGAARPLLTRVACHGEQANTAAYALHRLADELQPEERWLATELLPQEMYDPEHRFPGDPYGRRRPVPGAAAGPLSGTGRSRVPVADAAALAEEARRRLDVAPDDLWGLAVLPWVGGDGDVARLRSEMDALAALGTPTAEAELVARGGPVPLSWCRTERCMAELRGREGAMLTSRGLGLVSEAGVAEVRRGQAVYHDGMEPSPDGWTISEHRRALADGHLFARPLPSVEARLLSGDLSLVAHPGHRWTALRVLDRMDDPVRAKAVERLLCADWWHQEPPRELVAEARRDDGRCGLELLAAVGDEGPVREALAGPRARDALQLIVDHRSDLAASYAFARGQVRAGRVPAGALGPAMRDEGLREDARWALDGGAVDRCLALGWSWEVSDDRSVARDLEQCSTIPGSDLRRNEERSRGVQEVLLAEGTTARSLKVALGLGPVVLTGRERWFGMDDSEVRGVLAGRLLRERVDAPWVREVAVRWADDPASWPAVAGLVVRVAPEVALPVVRERSHGGEGWAHRWLARLGSEDDVRWLVERMRGCPDDELASAAWVVEKQWPEIYEANRETVDRCVDAAAIW